MARLQAIYLQAGIDVPPAALAEGLAAARDGRFVYVRRRGWLGWLARVYVMRERWVPPTFAIVLVMAVALAAYFFGYRPYRASQAEQARLELNENLPAAMDRLYQDIFNETKVQTAAVEADALRTRGKAALDKRDRAGAERAVADLTALRDRLALVYTIRVVDADGVKPGFWTFPASNSEATSYYVVVEAVDSDGNVLPLPIANDDTGLTQTVTRWGLRVPQAIYDAIIADKQDDGIIQHGLVGYKEEGYEDIDYAIPVLGGTLTQW